MTWDGGVGVCKTPLGFVGGGGWVTQGGALLTLGFGIKPRWGFRMEEGSEFQVPSFLFRVPSYEGERRRCAGAAWDRVSVGLAALCATLLGENRGLRPAAATVCEKAEEGEYGEGEGVGFGHCGSNDRYLCNVTGKGNVG